MPRWISDRASEFVLPLSAVMELIFNQVSKFIIKSMSLLTISASCFRINDARIYSLSCLSPRDVLDHDLKALTLHSTICRISSEVDFGTVVRASPVAGFLTSNQSFVVDYLVRLSTSGRSQKVSHYSYPPDLIIHEVTNYSGHHP
jgi:hypothetical protein